MLKNDQGHSIDYFKYNGKENFEMKEVEYKGMNYDLIYTDNRISLNEFFSENSSILE